VPPRPPKEAGAYRRTVGVADAPETDPNMSPNTPPATPSNMFPKNPMLAALPIMTSSQTTTSTVTMVRESERRIAPKCTDEAVTAGAYDGRPSTARINRS
jgi:hypothetical protein